MTQEVRYKILGSDVCVLQVGHRRLKKVRAERTSFSSLLFFWDVLILYLF